MKNYIWELKSACGIMAIAIIMIFAGEAKACSVSQSETTGTLANGYYTITISGGVGTRTIDFATLGTGSNTVKAERLRQAIQNFFDVRIPLSLLTTDDTDKILDPNRDDLFWGDANGIPQPNPLDNTHLIGRGCLATVEVIGSGGSATLQVILTSTTV